MRQTKPYFNIVTPKDIRQIFKTERKKFFKRLHEILELTKIGSIRLEAANLNRTEVKEITDSIKQICGKKIPILLENNIDLVVQLKLDGVHLTDGQKFVSTAKSMLSQNQVIGAFCGSSKHSGFVASEHGANYISFRADYDSIQNNNKIIDLFKWWGEFIEIPVMGECSDNCLISKNIWNYSDIISLKNKIWNSEISVDSIFKPVDPD